jgi:hypothetical protein
MGKRWQRGLFTTEDPESTEEVAGRKVESRKSGKIEASIFVGGRDRKTVSTKGIARKERTLTNLGCGARRIDFARCCGKALPLKE